MTSNNFITLLLLSLLCALVSALDHEKSYLLQKDTSNVYSIALYKDSLLLTVTNDIVQKDFETGLMQRTFRAHGNKIQSFIVTNDARMITQGYDDMIIVWSLETGAVLKKRIWLGSSNTFVQSISYQGDQVFTGGRDAKVRHVDLISSKVVETMNFNGQVYSVVAEGDFLYVGKPFKPEIVKIYIPTWSLYLSFEGHSNTVFSLSLYGNMLFSGSEDKTIICWNSENGAIIRQFLGAYKSGNGCSCLYNDELYSTSPDRSIIKWNIYDGQILKAFPLFHTQIITCFDYQNGALFSGSYNATVIK